MANLRRHQLSRLLLVLLVLLQSSAILAADEVLPQNSPSNWLEETLHRFFANSELSSDNIEGEGLELVGPYVEFEGKTIDVVIVRQVKNFEDGWDADRMDAERIIHSFASRFQDYTRESIIRQYLLFKAGDTLVPFDLADTERLLRDLSYINDVRIHVVSLDGEPDKVGIIVETNDRWPLGISATVVTSDKWRAKLYSNNVAGLGITFSNEVLYNKESSTDWGYRGELEKSNIGGSFWDAQLNYENSYRKQNLLLGVSRLLTHPGVNYIGGAQWQDLEEYNNDESDRPYHETDLWMGKVINLYDRMQVGGGGRPVLVPAFRVLDRNHYKRPVVFPDSNRSFHNYTQYMTSLTWQRLKSYKTNYLYGEGEIEDLPTGLAFKLTAGIEDREFETRPGLFFDSAIVSMRNRGDITFLGFSLGGYLDEEKVSDGILDVNGTYFSKLFGDGRTRHRFYSGLSYTLGIGRHPQSRIFLGDESGIYNLDNRLVAGNQRLVLKSLYRMFTHYSVWGFRMSFFSFADVGAIGGEDSSIFKEKFYLSTGLGVRFRNPFLVLPTVQLRVSMVTNVNEPGFSFGVKVGNVPGPDIVFPGSKPGTLAYE